VTLIIEAALYADGKTFVDFALSGITEQFDVNGNIINGYLVTYIILQSLIVNIPLLVALVAGDTLAGEANLGTLRLLLTKPISRSQLVWAKFLASVVTSVAALSVLLSVFAENSIGPIVSTMGIILFFTIITNLGLPSFEVIKPWLMTTHMIAWKGFFDNPVPYDAIFHSALVLVAYIVVFMAATIFIFNSKDIQS